MISIIVPSFNHAPYLRLRIESILSQTFQDFEIIILDDCSTDNSWEFLLQYSSLPKVSHCIRNTVNSGSTFKQWKKGIELAKGEVIWIAESDDWADPDFLMQTFNLMNSKQLALVITGSHYVDSEDKIIDEVKSEYGRGVFEGNQFCRDFMYSRNGIVNASAVIFSKVYVKNKMLDRIEDFKLSGDHFFWVQLLKDQRVGVLDNRLNYFRWHSKSVRVSESKKLTELIEGILIKKWVEQNFTIDFEERFQARRNAYLTYFKFIRYNKNLKKKAELRTLISFFNPIDRIKLLIRYFLLK